MSIGRREWLLLGVLGALLLGLFSFIPSTFSGLYASPDETAVAAAANQIAHHAQASVVEPLAATFPWIHPRSWVSVGTHIAPVGFLGFSLLLSLPQLLLGSWALSWIGALLLLSSAWPLFQLLRRFGFVAAWWGTLVAFTAPAVILYGNRGLFTNVAFVALALWTLWFITQWKESARSWKWQVFGGALVALTVSVRPSELIWFLPWMVWACWGMRLQKKAWRDVLIGAAIVIIPLLWLAHGAYGAWFGLGYFSRDNPAPVIAESGSPAAVAASAQSLFRLLPYGFHPHLIWSNVRSYFASFLWPWLLLLVSACTIRFWRFRPAWRMGDVPWYAGIWTFAALLIVYGSGLYADNINGTVTVGNSFLRYLLPLSPLAGAAFAWIWQRVRRSVPARAFLVLVAVALACVGSYRAFAGDEESVLATRQEILRYASIRSAAQQWFQPGDVIFSDRSDKIFFPAFRSVSPLPSREEVARLAHTPGTGIGLFSRPLSQSQKDAWRNVGLDAREVSSFGREILYRLSLVSS